MLTGKLKMPFWKSIRDLAHSPLKYGPQPTQTELVWRMPWGCWLEYKLYNDDQMLSEAWNATTKEFSENWPSTAVHQIQGA